jgi:predicted Na+-dependent transporter
MIVGLRPSEAVSVLFEQHNGIMGDACMQAYGNEALALLLTVGSNSMAIFTVPYVLRGILSSTAGVRLNAVELIINLVLTILVPLIIGKLLLEFIPAIQRFVKSHGILMKLLNNGSLVLIVWQSISREQVCPCSIKCCAVRLHCVSTALLNDWVARCFHSPVN